MAMADIRRAFQKGLGARGSLRSARMKYEPDEQSKRTVNRLTFDVVFKNSVVSVTDTLPASGDPVAKARSMGEAFTGD